MICSNLASLWKIINYFGGLYITQSNIYDGTLIAKIVIKYIYFIKVFYIITFLKSVISVRYFTFLIHQTCY